MSLHPTDKPIAESATEQPLGVPGMDPVASQRWLNRVPGQSPWLHEEVGARMADRLGWLQQPPRSWLDWNPALGGWKAAGLVAERYQKSEFFVPSPLYLKETFASDFAGSLWQKFRKSLQGRGHAKVISGDVKVELIWANMLLHAAVQPREFMRNWFNHLKVNGFLMFSGLGPDSLREVRQVYRQLNWAEPAHGFTDMHDWGDMLVSTGFADPVMDTEQLVLTYSSAQHLLDDLRTFGRNLSAERRQMTCSRSWHNQLLQGMERHMPRDADGRLQLTLEVVYGHAFKGVPRHKVSPETRLSVTDLKDMLGSGPRNRI
jgi:malonyl-CoA O-methyltransferase